MNTKKIKILDSTLREGEQTPGVYFDKHIKFIIAEMLDEIGVDIIEAGHPVVSKEIYESVKEISINQNIKARVAAHSRSVDRDIELALESKADMIGIFYCVSEERIKEVFKSNLKDSIKSITKSINRIKSKKSEIWVRYTPEDTVRSSFSNVCSAAIEAVKEGADIISIADTTGYMVPNTERSMYDFTSKLRDELMKNNCEPMIAVHCHNDRGLALANSLDALRAGAEIVDVTVLGLGERAGITDLAQLISLLTIDFKMEERWNLNKLESLYKLVSKYSGVSIPSNMPFIGENAFTHCAGVHTHAAAVNPAHYQSINPTQFNREMKVSLDHMSGISSIRFALEKIGVECDDKEILLEILRYVKVVGSKSKTVDQEELIHIYRFISKDL
jgi:2-isopropylmalate synthase